MIKLLAVLAILASPTVANPTMPGYARVVISSTPGKELKPGWHLPNQNGLVLRAPPQIPSNLPTGPIMPVLVLSNSFNFNSLFKLFLFSNQEISYWSVTWSTWTTVSDTAVVMNPKLLFKSKLIISWAHHLWLLLLLPRLNNRMKPRIQSIVTNTSMRNIE